VAALHQIVVNSRSGSKRVFKEARRKRRKEATPADRGVNFEPRIQGGRESIRREIGLCRNWRICLLIASVYEQRADRADKCARCSLLSGTLISLNGIYVRRGLSLSLSLSLSLRFDEASRVK